jgi:hypothetical protein
VASPANFAPIRRWLLTLDPSGGKVVADNLERMLFTANTASSTASDNSTDITTLQGDVTTLQTEMETALADAADAALLTPPAAVNPDEISQVVSLQSPFFYVTDYGAKGDGATDDTSAIQRTINAAEAAGGGTVYFPRGIYIVGGALQDTSHSNAQLLLPRITGPAGETITVEFRGEAPPPHNYSVIGASPLPDNLSVVKGTLNSGTGALLGGRDSSGSFTAALAVIRNLAFQMPADPALTALDLSGAAEIDLDNVLVHAGSFDVASIAAQSTSTSYGLRMPGRGNGATSRLGIVTVVGFYNGVEVGEHAAVGDLNIAACRKATVFTAQDHSSHFDRLLIQWCQRMLVVTGAHYFNIDQLNIEHAASGTWAPVYDIDDASNLGHGRLWWHVVKAGVGADSTFTVNGATNIAYRKLDDDYLSGSPTSGALAKFSDATSLTSGNLSGDVTTSDTLATTLAASGVVAGTYTNATVTLDAKGRATSASSGASGAYLPLVTGAEPPVLVSDGAGHLIAVGYTP